MTRIMPYRFHIPKTQRVVLAEPCVPDGEFAATFPLGLFAGGIRDLTAALVEEIRDEDRFVDLVFELLNWSIEHGHASGFQYSLEDYLDQARMDIMTLQLGQFHRTEAARMMEVLHVFGPLATFQVEDWAVGGVIVDVESQTFIQNFQESPHRARRRLYKAGLARY